MLFELFSGQLGLLGFLVWGVSLVIVVTVHEFSHAFVAEKLGDGTPRLLGRVTLNPLAHLDPLGTLMIVLTRFGWGKPVSINPFNFENPLRDSALVSLAGPASNLIFAFLLALPLRAGLIPLFLIYPYLSVIALNVGLAVFNLIPIYPLDGFRIVAGILPTKLALSWEQTAQYGFILIMVFVFLPLGNTSLISLFVQPVAQTFLKLILGSSVPLF